MSDKLLTPVTGTCISASAGTGKTYALTSRFIALLSLGAPPESLIALTFTNKAAGEFRNRILSSLAAGALFESTEEKPFNPLTIRVVETLCGRHLKASEKRLVVQDGLVPLSPALATACEGLSEWNACLEKIHGELKHTLDAAYFKQLLCDVVRRLSRMQLSTIDSFFQKIVSSHCTDFGISEIQPLTGEALEQAQRQALLSLLALMNDKDCRDAFLTLYRDATGKSGGRMLNALSEKVKDFQTLYRNLPNEESWTDSSAFIPDLLSEEDYFSKEKQNEAWQQYAEVLEQVQLEGDAQKSEIKALVAFPKQMQKEDYSTKTLLENYLKNVQRVGPNHEKMKSLVRDIRERCRRNSMYRGFFKTVGMYKLMSFYQGCYRNEVQSTGRFTFDDMTTAAGNILRDGGCDAASELDARLEHWMLDEFQDTSPAQWKSLVNPLLLDAAQASEERYQGKQLAKRSLFVVGDLKQSIYGFRHAKPSLFAQLSGLPEYAGRDQGAEQCKPALHPARLTCSYRSAPVLMGSAAPASGEGVAAEGFINTLFRSLHLAEQEAHPAKEGEDDYAVSLAGYADHSTADTNTMRNMKGYVRISSPSEEEDGEEAILESIAAIVGELCEGTPEKRLKNSLTVAVLVRSNEDAESVVRYLRKQKDLKGLPVQLISDSFVAMDSPAGEMLMSFFLWLAHPSDSYRKHLLDLGNALEPKENHAFWVSRLEKEGYAAVVAALCQRMGFVAESVAKDWYTAALTFDEKGGGLSDWIHAIRQLSVKGVGSPLHVQVMTMHKSKGLEFDAVILPYMGKRAVDYIGNLSYFESKDEKHIMLSPGNAEKRSAFGNALDSHIERWKQQRRQEAYNLMYVAMTRAKYANYILVPEIPAAGSEADFILTAFPDAGESLRNGESWSVGLPMWYEDEDFLKEKRNKENGRRTVSAALQPLGSAVAHLPSVSPSKIEPTEQRENKAEAEESAKKRKKITVEDSAAFGTAVHALFEQLEWYLPGESLAWAAGIKPCRNGAQPTPEQVVYAALQVPEVADLFRRKDNLAAYNEQPFGQMRDYNGGPVRVSGIIDRLVLERTLTIETLPDGDTVEHEEVTAAHIIDYKTNVRSEGLNAEQQDNELRKEYRGQMEAYRTLICAAFRLTPDKVSVTLVSVPSNGAPARLVPVPM